MYFNHCKLVCDETALLLNSLKNTDALLHWLGTTQVLDTFPFVPQRDQVSDTVWVWGSNLSNGV
jgi:hypothetical protein